MKSNVYPLHLERGLPITGARVARYSLDSPKATSRPRAQHVAGRGSPLVAAVIAACATIHRRARSERG
jgi:hypothetical protein